MSVGLMEPSTADAWVAQASQAHDNNPVLQRDEAIRSASLAAMTLILAAEGLGLTSGAMIGFDMASLAREFNLMSHEIPAIVVTVGYPASGNWPQKPRRPLSDVLQFV